MSKQANRPLVSIVMPVYNYENYVTAAVDSLLKQTYENLEIIVIDDQSKDDSWRVIQELAKKDKRIRPFQNPKNLKQTRTRNFGIGQAKGEFVAFMDADDERPINGLEQQVQYLLKHPD